ncbi:unnamed protein product [Amoebophrya sp. A120]|nr:unnamed protein product [Amoebophrya sp. A120]|eukprot:GSA120T00024158001.1
MRRASLGIAFSLLVALVEGGGTPRKRRFDLDEGGATPRLSKKQPVSTTSGDFFLSTRSPGSTRPNQGKKGGEQQALASLKNNRVRGQSAGPKYRLRGKQKLLPVENKNKRVLQSAGPKKYRLRGKQTLLPPFRRLGAFVDEAAPVAAGEKEHQGAVVEQVVKEIAPAASPAGPRRELSQGLSAYESSLNLRANLAGAEARTKLARKAVLAAEEIVKDSADRVWAERVFSTSSSSDITDQELLQQALLDGVEAEWSRVESLQRVLSDIETHRNYVKQKLQEARAHLVAEDTDDEHDEDHNTTSFKGLVLVERKPVKKWLSKKAGGALAQLMAAHENEVTPTTLSHDLGAAHDKLERIGFVDLEEAIEAMAALEPELERLQTEFQTVANEVDTLELVSKEAVDEIKEFQEEFPSSDGGETENVDTTTLPGAGSSSSTRGDWRRRSRSRSRSRTSSRSTGSSTSRRTSSSAPPTSTSSSTSWTRTSSTAPPNWVPRIEYKTHQVLLPTSSHADVLFREDGSLRKGKPTDTRTGVSTSVKDAWAQRDTVSKLLTELRDKVQDFIALKWGSEKEELRRIGEKLRDAQLLVEKESRKASLLASASDDATQLLSL